MVIILLLFLSVGLLSILPVLLRAFITTPAGGVGYRGWLKVGDVMVPVRTCSIEETPHPIIGDDLIHGSSNEPLSASVKNWAEGQYDYAGDIDTDLFANFWSTLKDWAVEDRHASQTVIFSPNNQDVYTYSSVFVNTMTLTGNLGGNITVRVGVVAKSRTATGTVGTYGTFTLNEAPIPYWKSVFEGTTWGSGDWASFGGASDDMQVIAWTLTVRNNTITQFTFDGTQYPHYVQQGMIGVEGSITVFDENGVPAPSDGGSAVITITGAGTVTLPYIVITSYPMPTAGTSAKVTRTVNFRSLGTDAANSITLA